MKQTTRSESQRNDLLRRLRWNVALMLASLCVGLVTVELGARYFLNERTNLEGMYTGDAVVGATLRPGFHGSHRTAEFQYDVTINEMGMRDDPIPGDLKRALRILVIGDSFVFGQGVQLTETLPKVLRQRLKTSHPERPVEVFNAGVPGHGPFHELHRLRRLAPVIEPHVVLHVVFMGDDWYGNGPRQSPEEAKGDVIQQLRRHSSSFRLVDRFLISRLKGEDQYEAQRVHLRPEFLARMDQVLALLQETRSFSSQIGAKYLIVLCPRYSQVYDDAWAKARIVYGLAEREYTRSEPNRTFAERLKARGFSYVDLLDPFRQEGQRRRLHFDIDGHWNAKGNEYVADLLTPQVDTLLRSLDTTPGSH